MGKDYHAQGAGKRFSSANNRPEEGISGRITTPTTDQKHMGKNHHAHGAGKRVSSANNRPEEVWGRTTTPRELEKDVLQLTTDQKKAYGEGLPRPGRPASWKKIFFS